MKVLFGTYSLAFQNPGGGEQVLRALRAELTKLGHQVDFYNPWTMDSRRLCEYDVIHYFSCLEPSFWVHFKQHAPNVPLVVTPTLYQPKGPIHRLKVMKRRLIDKIANDGPRFDLPDQWLATTRREGLALHDYWGIKRKRISVVANGVDERFVNADATLFLAKTEVAQPFVLHVGRFHPVKNHLALIQAARLARLHVVFIGEADPGMSDYYMRCVEEARSAETSTPGVKFTFLGALKHDDPLLASAYAAAHVFALPSEFETFGISALEAGLAGCGLVMTQNLEAREVFAPIATLVDPEDVARLAQGLQAAMAAPRAKTRPELVNQYSWPAIARQVAAVYAEQKTT